MTYTMPSVYKTITSDARVKVPKTATISGNARIKITQPKTITGNAKTAFTHYETMTANARTKVPIPKTIAGTALIKKTLSQTTTGTAKIVFRYYETINGTARIKTSKLKTIEGNATIVVQQYETINGTARIKVPTTETVVGTARIKKSFLQLLMGNARIKRTFDESIESNARILIMYRETIPANARIKAPKTAIINGNALVCFRYYKTIPSNARIESIQWYDIPLSYRFDRENRARAIAGVANSIMREWWVTPNEIFCMFDLRGHDKSATVTLSDDIISIDQSFDATKIIDKLTVVGAGPGSTHLEVTVGTGEMEGTFSAKDIHDIDTLTSFANAMLEQTKRGKHRMLVTLAGTERTDFELGDIAHVTDPDVGIDGNYRIISMKRVSGVEGEYTELEIAVPQFRVTETLADAERRADATDYHPQGAPSIITHDKSENVDATHSLSLKFYIPEEAVDMGKLQIKEAKVALVLEPFRAHSTGAAAGGGQTTSSGGGQTTSSGGGQTSSGGSAHSHGIPAVESQNCFWESGTTSNVWCKGMSASGEATNSSGIYSYQTGAHYKPSDKSVLLNIQDHHHAVPEQTSVSESAHTHTVSNHTHSVSDHTHSVSNHTHSIVYGIYTSTSPANVYIKLNGTQIAGPFNADTFADITDAFLEQIATYGWNTLEFTSTQLGKIGATLFMRLFLQAS